VGEIGLQDAGTRASAFAGRVTSSAVAWGGAMTLLRGIGFLTVMAYALRTIPTPEIGLWYVMLSIAGLGGIVEFGFASTISRHASYYSGGAVEIPRVGVGQAVPGVMNKSAIVSLVEMARRLYLFFGVLVGALMLVTAIGWFYWGQGSARPVALHAVVAFLLLLVGTAFNMTGLFWGAILYGMDRVRQYNQWMVAGLVANYVVTLAGLIAGAGIVALVIGQILGGLVPRLGARHVVSEQLRGAEPAAAGIGIAWRDLWPTTWRAGVLTLCTYLMFGTTTLLCSVFADIRTAASYGLTFQLAVMLHTTSALWVWVKIPVLGAMRVQGNWTGVLRLLRRRLPASVVTYVVGATVMAFAAPWALSHLHSRTEMLPPAAMMALLALVGLDLIVSLHSLLLQTGNEVPHVRAFCVSACLTLLLVWPLGSRFHLWGVMAAPFLAQVMANYWWVPYQFWARLHAGIRGQEVGVE
jgi:hypothetical protein